MLSYILKSVNISNDSRVSKTDVKSFSSQYVLDVYSVTYIVKVLRGVL